MVNVVSTTLCTEWFSEVQRFPTGLPHNPSSGKNFVPMRGAEKEIEILRRLLFGVILPELIASMQVLTDSCLAEHDFFFWEAFKIPVLNLLHSSCVRKI
jgi:hypothetical protein